MNKYPLYQELDENFKSKFEKALGSTNAYEIYQVHPDVIDFLFYNPVRLDTFLQYYKNTGNLEEDFSCATRRYFYERSYVVYHQMINGKIEHIFPDWLESMHFKLAATNLMRSPKEIEEFKRFSNRTIFQEKYYGKVINLLGIENIKRFEEETGFFSYCEDSSKPIQTLERLMSHIDRQTPTICLHTYQEFKDFIAKWLDENRSILSAKINYNAIKGDFRKEYSFLFLPDEAPEELKNVFYYVPHKITYSYLGNHLDYLPYLQKVNLSQILDSASIKLKSNLTNRSSMYNFNDFYISTYGQVAFLELIRKFGGTLLLLKRSHLELVIDSKETIESSLRALIYEELASDSDINYKHLVANNPEFVQEYPDIFINYDEIPLEGELKDQFYAAYYSRSISFEYIQKHPEIVNLLKNKNLKIILASCYSYETEENKVEALQLLDYLDNESFLKLVTKYGEYLYAVDLELDESFMTNHPSFEGLCQEIEKCISKTCRLGRIYYDPKDAPAFLKEENPDLFLDEDAPELLYNAYYSDVPGFNCEFISEHREFLPYLKDKSMVAQFYNNASFTQKEEVIKFFTLFDTNTALKLIVDKPSTISQVINDEKSEVLKIWYEKTGRKFIPDYIVMTLFKIEEIDKFLANSKTWSKLQKITRYTDTPEHKDALLKLAYTFGIFEGTKDGYNKLVNLLNGIPKSISKDLSFMIYKIDALCNKCNISILTKLIAEHPPTTDYEISKYPIEAIYQLLLQELQTESIDYDKKKPIMAQLYRENQEGNFALTINPEKFPRIAILIRLLFEASTPDYFLTPNICHRFISGFALTYDKDFRDFFLENLHRIFKDTKNASQLANVQKRFREIKVTNSNRTLTWDLAVGYCLTNRYSNVDIGNRPVAEIASIAGYSEQDFETLQQIYNYGKKRVFSSIPRITGEQKGYTYEILRLDDPLALAIGTLTDCCQEIGNVAETCVEHSVVDQNGRVFVVKDEEGNIVAQSWVWRNNSVLCFDNIEIPEKAFKRANTSQIGSSAFTDKVFNIYKKAAQELLATEEKTLRKLLEQEKITASEYEANRLKRVTVGIGYNDIAESIKKHARLVKTSIAHPLPFTPPIPLKYHLWTSDSMTQYLMSEITSEVTVAPKTYTLYTDPFIIYDENTFSPQNLIHLQELERNMEDRYFMKTELSNPDEANLKNIAYSYGTNPLSTKILLNANLAIIYEEEESTIRVMDLFYNLTTGAEKMSIEDTILLQLKLAFDQISTSKKVDISLLNEEQLSMYNRSMSITEQEINKEKGMNSTK